MIDITIEYLSPQKEGKSGELGALWNGNWQENYLI